MNRNIVLILLCCSTISSAQQDLTQQLSEQLTQTATDEQIKAEQEKQKKADAEKIHLGAAHGYAFLERIRNMTEFPVSIYYNKTIHDLIPADSVVRIKSYRDGGIGKYYAARLEGGSWRLKADTVDPKDPATEFVVHRHVSRDLSDWIGFTSVAVGKEYLDAKLSQSVQFQAPNFADDEITNAHWKIIGSTINRCALQNRLTGGLLSCREAKDKTDIGVYTPPPPVEWKYKEVRTKELLTYYEHVFSPGLKSKTLGPRQLVPLKHNYSKLGRKKVFNDLYSKTDLYTGTTYLSAWSAAWGDDAAKDPGNKTYFIRDKEKNPYQLYEMMRYINMARYYIFTRGAKKAERVIAEEIIKKFTQEAEKALKRHYEKKKQIYYGDKVKIVHRQTWQNLYGDKSRGKESVFAGNDNTTDEHTKEKDSWFIIKGPHKKNDAWNCNIGEPVKNGDVIRLEHVINKKNISCTRQNADPQKNKKATLTVDSFGEADLGEMYLVQLLGKNGINSSDDNWTVTFEEEAEELYEGGSFYLTHRNSGFSLRSHSELIGKSPNKQRVVAFQTKKPACLWFINAVEHGEQPVVDIAWTGFPNGSPALDETPKESIGFEIVKLGMGGGISPGMTLDFYMPLEGKKPKAAGFAKQEIPGFGPDQLINLSPLISKGVAWMQQSFTDEGKATISFLARATDKGNIQVMLGNNVSLDYTWKIVIGANQNTKTQIIRRDYKAGIAKDIVVAEISKDQNPLAIATPGVFLPYWVSVDDGSIMVGMSTTPGENVFLAWRDPNPRTKVSRIGFGTHDAPVEYTGVQMTSPVTTQMPPTTYVRDKKALTPTSDPLWLASPFRVPGRGTISFKARGKPKINILLSEANTTATPHYKIELNTTPSDEIIVEKAEPTSAATLYKSSDPNIYKEIARSQDEENSQNFLQDKHQKYWISITQGRIFIGRGDIGENLFLYHWDIDPYDNVKKIGISCDGEGQIEDIVVAPQITIAPQTKKATYQEKQQLFEFSGSLYVISPYEYLLSQEGQAVKFEDKINKKTYYPGKTPQQDAKYYFMLVLQPDGFPLLEWLREPENPQKLALDKAAYITRTKADAWYQASTFVQGLGALGGLIGVKYSIDWGKKAASLMQQSGRMEAESAFGFRGHDSYVYTDQAVQGELATSTIPEAAQENKRQLAEKIELGGKWTPSTMDKLERLIPLYKQAINLINHPHVVSNTYEKSSLFDAMGSLFEGHKRIHDAPGTPIDLTYSGMINLLISAYNNPYLRDPNDPQDTQRKVWYTQINELAQQILEKDEDTKLDLQPCYGEYIWMTEKLETPGKGSISFEARGTNDIFVAFASEAQQLRNTDTNFYETVIGGWNNEKTVIRVRSLDKAVAETMERNALVTQVEYQRYWVSVNNGTISMGKGELEEKNKIFEWNDPYPIKDVKYIGLSNWDTPVSFRKIQIYPCPVEEAQEYKQKLFAQYAQLIAQQKGLSQIELPQVELPQVELPQPELPQPELPQPDQSQTELPEVGPDDELPDIGTIDWNAMLQNIGETTAEEETEEKTEEETDTFDTLLKELSEEIEETPPQMPDTETQEELEIKPETEDTGGRWGDA